MTWKPATISAISVVDGVVVVENGGDSNISRPPAPLVYWKGTAEPSNAAPGDFYIETDGSGNVVSVKSLVSQGQLQELGGEPGPTGPTGPAGSEGPTGPTGPAGSAGGIENLTNVTITSPEYGDIIAYDNGQWVNSSMVEYISHGSDATVARPQGALKVVWTGSVMPDNGTVGDNWLLDRSHLPAPQLWVHNGSAWVRQTDGELGYPGADMQLEFTTASAGTTVCIPLQSPNVTIDWGDGTVDTGVTTTNPTHVYSSAGTYDVTVSGSASGLGTSTPTPRNQFVNNVSKFYTIGRLGITTFANAFKDLGSGRIVYADAWDVSSVTNMGNMFQDSKFNRPIGSWDVSSVTTMYNMFRASSFNQPIDFWDVSSVTLMGYMFYSCPFNQNIGSWNVSSVTNMEGMFRSCPFNQNIGSWNVSSVTNMGSMFNSSSFDQPIGSWNVSSVTNMSNMFRGASAFQQPLNTWIFSGTVDLSSFMASKTSPNQYNTTDYNNLLVQWDALVAATTLNAARTVDMGGAKYSAAGTTARANLVAAGWTIVDGGAA